MTNETKHLSTEHQRSHKRFKWMFVLIGIGLCVWLYSSLRERILPIERIDAIRWGSSDNVERYFSRSFPTAQEIKSYLSNATILVSSPPGGNVVYYFDAPYHFLEWRNAGTSAVDVLSGSWSIDWHIRPMELNGRWRVAIEYVICTRSPDSLPADVPFCSEVRTLNPINRFGLNQEYRAGNVFNLSADGNVPFPLPTRTTISIDGLLAMGKTQRGQ